MLDAFEARLKPRLKPNQTLEERMRAYPDPNLETKSLEIFRKMIEGTQALLEKQMGQSGPSKGPETEQPEGRQVSSGPENLVSMEGKVAEGS